MKLKKGVVPVDKMIQKGFYPPKDVAPGYEEPKDQSQMKKAKFGAISKLLSDTQRKANVGIADKFKEPLAGQPKPFIPYKNRKK